MEEGEISPRPAILTTLHGACPPHPFQYTPTQKQPRKPHPKPAHHSHRKVSSKVSELEPPAFRARKE